MHLILTGATGTLGLATLHHCLSNPQVTQLSILSRREVPQAAGHPKAEVILHKNFTEYPDDILEKLKGARGCVWAQGISQSKVNKEEYTRITYEFPLAAAKAMSGLSDQFNFVYVSGEGADPSEKGMTLFSKVKGRTEKDLLSLSSSQPSLRVYNVRPGAILPHQSAVPVDRPRTFLERASMVLIKPLVAIAPSLGIPSDKCGEYLVKLALGNGEPLKEGPGIEAGGRTVRNTAMRSAMDL